LLTTVICFIGYGAITVLNIYEKAVKRNCYSSLRNPNFVSGRYSWVARNTQCITMLIIHTHMHSGVFY